jgi:hypothetical protein
VEAAERLGEVTVQARKTYVSLVSPRRTFARVQATTRDRVDLGLRIEKLKPAGRLRASRMHETMRLQVSLATPDDLDAKVLAWLRRAYRENSCRGSGPNHRPPGRTRTPTDFPAYWVGDASGGAAGESECHIEWV